jgi:ABC-type uncharacterized transport system auxiliary subunit
MKTASWKGVLALTIILIAGGCSGLQKPSNQIDYYTLEYDSPAVEGLSKLPCVLRLARFTVAPTYNTDRIVYSDRSYKRKVYAYHKWRANPADLVTSFLERDIRGSGLFQAVVPEDSRFPSSYYVEGAVEEFYEKDTETGWMAVLGINVALMAENEPDVTKRVLFQKTYRFEEPCQKKNPRALARAMSQAMSRMSEALIHETYDALQSRSGR